MVESNGKLAKRFQLITNKTTMPEQQCAGQHWAKLSKSNETTQIRTEFSFGFKDLSVADLTLEDLDDTAKMEGAFLADNGCEELLQHFALELYLAQNVNIWKNGDCKWEWEFSNENETTTTKQPVIPTDGPDISPVTDSPKVSKDKEEASTSTSTSTTTTSTTTTTTVTTTTKMPTTTKEPVDWAFDSEEGATFGNSPITPIFLKGDATHQHVLRVGGILEPWARSMVVNMSIHGCYPLPYKVEECEVEKIKPLINVQVQFGVSFDPDGKAVCWLKGIENSKLVDTGGFCNGSGLFKRGERFELIFGMFNGDGNEDGVPDAPVNFNVKFGALGIGEYTRQKMYTPIMGGYSVKLHGSVRPFPSSPQWAIPYTNYVWLDEHKLLLENVKIFGYVPMLSEKFQIRFFSKRPTKKRHILSMYVDVKQKEITIEHLKNKQYRETTWINGSFPSGFIAGEDFEMSVVKRACQEWWIWVITVNSVTFDANVNSGVPGNQQTPVYAQFFEVQMLGGVLYYRHEYLPAVEENCVPTAPPIPDI